MILQVGGHTVAACRECSLDLSRNMIEIAGDSATAQSFIPGRYGATLSASGLYGIDSSVSLAESLIAGTMVEFSFIASGVTGEKADVYSGKAYIDRFSPSGSVKSLATYSASLKTTGDISIRQIEAEWHATLKLIAGRKISNRPAFRPDATLTEVDNSFTTSVESNIYYYLVDAEVTKIDTLGVSEKCKIDRVTYTELLSPIVHEFKTNDPFWGSSHMTPDEFFGGSAMVTISVSAKDKHGVIKKFNFTVSFRTLIVTP